MLPSTLALVDDDPEFREFLASFLRGRGVNVSAFADGAKLLTSPEVFEFQFYVLGRDAGLLSLTATGRGRA